MKLPEGDSAEIAEEKLTEYLLSATHRDGRHKAAFFRSYGFLAETWSTLASAPRGHIAEHEVAKEEDSPFGKRFVVEGELQAPDGRRPLVRSIWFIRTCETFPRFVSAYPMKRKQP